MLTLEAANDTLADLDYSTKAGSLTPHYYIERGGRMLEVFDVVNGEELELSGMTEAVLYGGEGPQDVTDALEDVESIAELIAAVNRLFDN